MKTVVFDFDGTLLDSRRRHTTLLGDICKELHFDISKEQLKNYLPSKLNGISTRRYLVEMCGFPEKDAKKCSDLWVERIETWEYLREDVLYPDAMETLNWLAERDDVNLVLITARKSEQMLFQQLEKYQLRPFFSQVFCVPPASATEHKKGTVAQLNQVICFVGDTEVDYVAAMHKVCPFYALHRGFRSKEYWDTKQVKSYPDLTGLKHLLGV